MANNGEPADIKHVKSISKIWLVPFIAVCMGGWMFYHQWSNQGPVSYTHLTLPTTPYV